MTAGSDEPVRRSQDGARRTPSKSGKDSHSLAETTAFGTDAIARQTHVPLPRRPNVEGSQVQAPAASIPVAAPPAVPPEVVGRFRVGRLLGRGGMASVYLAEDVQLNRPVALKIPRMTDDPGGTLIPRFFREARTAATLNHPNICPIYDVGQDGDTYFIAMGYIQGRPLTAYISSGKRQPDRQVAIVVRKVAAALEHAHANGILHRDLKPANIMIDNRGEPIVMDFGLACHVDQNWETRITQDGTVIGTPAYMSPEQIDSRARVGPACDIYSLGVVMYELLTGQCPFTGSLVGVIGQVLHAQPKSVSELRPDVPPVLGDICSRAMAKNPQDRFASMKEFARELGAFLKGEAAGSSALQALQAATPAPNLAGLEALLSLSEPVPPEANRGVRLARHAASPKWSRPALWGIAGGAAGLVIAVAVLIAAGNRGSSPPDESRQASAAVGIPGDAHRLDQTWRRAGNAPSTPGDAGSRLASHRADTVSRAPTLPPLPATASADAAADDAEPADETPLAADEAAGGATESEPPGERADSDSTESPSGPSLSPATVEPTSPSSAKKPTGGVAAGQSPAAAGPKTGPPELPPGAPGAKPMPRFPWGREENDRPHPPGSGQIDSIEDLEKYFQESDHNGDKKLDRTEIPLHIIYRVHKNSDRAVSLDELKRAFKKMGKSLFAAPSPEEYRKLARPPGYGPGRPGKKSPRRGDYPPMRPPPR